jgi:predicted RNA binding protein YcfA (HicA-like mRNA interferase family)
MGYQVTRQSGSHIRLTTHDHGEHHLTVPNHDPIKVGTLSGILGEAAFHFQMTREQAIERLF